MRTRPMQLIAVLGPMLLATAAFSYDICPTRKSFTMIGNNFVARKFPCEVCFGDAINNNSSGPDYCPSNGADNCNGTCTGNSSIACTADADCGSSGTCQFTADGIITRCYGSGADNLSFSSGSPYIIDLGGGDDTLTLSGTAHSGNIIQGGTGNDHITISGAGAGGNWVNGGPFATSGSDISGDDVILAPDGVSGDTWIGGGGRDVMKNNSGSGGSMGTTGLTLYGAYPKVADDSVGSLICGGSAMTILGAGPRHQCMKAVFITNYGSTCYYQYDNAVLGTRSADGASDIGTTQGCGTSTHLGTGGLFEAPSSASCGCG